MDKNTLNLVPKEEQDNVSRSLLAWLNEYPKKPVRAINFEYLASDTVSMMLSVIQGAFKTQLYIRGAYRAQYQFKIVYRLQPGNSNNARLGADELLNALGDWAVSRKDFPDIGERKRVVKLECNTRSALLARYEGGTEDHQILMTMDYESY